MAVNETTDVDALGASPEPLACGRDTAWVWDRAESGGAPDEHERVCPQCSAAWADARSLHSVVHRLAAQQLQPPPSVLEHVMGAVRRELRPHDVLMLESPHGQARLSRPAAAAVLRNIVDRMDGVRARSCRIEQSPGRQIADVTITVSALFGMELVSVAARVRQMVIAAGSKALGVPVGRVDIEVVDIHGYSVPGYSGAGYGGAGHGAGRAR